MKYSVVLGILLAATLNCSATDALRWLAYHQEADGHWDSKKYEASKRSDTAATSLALLALLGAGNSEKGGEYKDGVKRAVAWLRSKQAADGKVFDTNDAKGVDEEAYAATLATLTLCEATAMANMPDTRVAAQHAVEYCTDVFPLQKKDGDTYGVRETANTAHLGLCIMTLKSAKVAGLKVPAGAFDAGIIYLDSVEHKVAGEKAEASAAGEYWLNAKERESEAHPSLRLTALGLVSRQFMGWKRDDLAASVERVVKNGFPVWVPKGEKADLLCWWLTTLCVFQQGGDVWDMWDAALKKELTDNERQDGDNAGSWDGAGFAVREWGRVGQTALAGLSLEIRQRFPRVKN